MDNTAVRQAQIARLEQLRAERDEAAVQAALDALKQTAASGAGNLLEQAVVAARARASLGEISAALEAVWGRHRATTRALTGVYRGEYGEREEIETVRHMADELAEVEGRRPRILVAKIGQDGHDRGAKVVASAYADFGFDVDIGPLFQTPAEVARQAMENDVHVVGVSTLAGGHKTLIPQLIAELAKLGRDDIRWSSAASSPPRIMRFFTNMGRPLSSAPEPSSPSRRKRYCRRCAAVWVTPKHSHFHYGTTFAIMWSQ